MSCELNPALAITTESREPLKMQSSLSYFGVHTVAGNIGKQDGWRSTRGGWSAGIKDARDT